MFLSQLCGFVRLERKNGQEKLACESIKYWASRIIDPFALGCKLSYFLGHLEPKYLQNQSRNATCSLELLHCDVCETVHKVKPIL